VEITVLPVNDPPVAFDDEFTIQEDETLEENVLSNDSDPEGEILWVATAPVESVSNGLLVLQSDGSFSYTPNKDYSGEDFFKYRVCDNADPSACDEALVTITIIDVEDPVIAYQALTPNDDSYNDLWVIDGIEQFPNNIVQVFDRWSSLIYRMQGYNNSDRIWNGDSNEGISTGELPDGTYFYVINLGDGNPILDGFVELKH
jgi:gliding motility-associated-like protein